jgi:hypothetical protein
MYEPPAGKRIRRLPDASVLGWFQRIWAATAGVVDIGDEWEAYQFVRQQLRAELGGEVDGLDAVFVAARQQGLDMPRSWQELRALLETVVAVEYEVRTDAHSVRAHTTNEDIYLAYYFFDDALAAARADRLAWLLHDGWELPADTGPSRPLQPEVPVRLLAPPTAGPGATYVVPPVDHDPLWWWARARPWMVAGVRLPQLAAWLRAVIPVTTEIRDEPYDPRTQTGHLDPHRFQGWPYPLLVLRALVAPGEERLAPALERCARWPGCYLVTRDYVWPKDRWLLGAHGGAHEQALERLLAGHDRGEQERGGGPSAWWVVREAEHLAQLALHASHAGYRYHFSWVLFDDLWAGAHPELARGMLRAASTWDPFQP